MSVFQSHFSEVADPALTEQFGDAVIQYPGGDLNSPNPITAVVNIGETELVEHKGGRKRYVTRGTVKVDDTLTVTKGDRWKVESETYDTERIGKASGGKRIIYVIVHDTEHTNPGQAT